MERKLLFSIVSAFLLLFLGYGCTDDYLSDREIQQMIDNSLDGQWQIISAEIRGGDWEWVQNNREGYYVATVDLPQLTTNIFNDGATLAYYKFDKNGKTALPYVKTIIGDDGIPFTETYSCDFRLGNPSTAIFYLEASDAARYNSEPPSASFQIVLIY